MTTTQSSGFLTPRQIVRLAAAISADNMESIAEGYLDISDKTIKNIRSDASNPQAFNRDILRYWANKYLDNQVESLAALLLEAASECGYVDARKVEAILDVQPIHPPQPTASMEELLTLAEDLRPHTAEMMKMEPAPWIKDYVVGMEELYAELSLEKIGNRLYGETRVLENYKVLFDPGMFEYLDIRYYIPSLRPKIKILIKGDPGMGKTSLVKKIAWDWANGKFITVSFVFFVFLKLVKPNDCIEDVIMQQNPVLMGFFVTRKKLIGILEYLGRECLLIFDGLDQCALGQNSDVHKIITGAKFKTCNVLLTSRPHCTREFEKYFDTVVSVEGFTRKEARKFVSRIVADEGKIEQILNFNPAGDRAHRPVHNVPILLSFLCVLVRDNDIDLSDKAISMGEIYFRMVQCLYKKFTIRKGIKFEKRSLVTVLMSIGKLALETLLSGDSLLERSKIIEQVGEDVFEYGLLIGQDGFSLTRDMTVDILVTFPHRSLQEFLGAFYFVLSLGKKQIVNHVHHVDKAVEEYLKNPLFSEFCLWLLDEANTFLSRAECSVAREMLIRYVTKQIHDVKIDLSKFPSFRLVQRNEIALKILEDALGKCCKMKHLVIHLNHPNQRILRSIDSVTFQRLNSIEIGEFAEEDEVELIPNKSPLRFMCERDCSSDLTVKCDHATKHEHTLKTVLKVCECRNRSVYLRVMEYGYEASFQNYPSVRTLSINSPSYGLRMGQMYPQLVNLFLIHCHLNDLSELAEASAQGRLPNLSTLEISKNILISGNLSALFRSTFASLHTLILSDCDLEVHNVDLLQQARKQRRLPKLRHLDVSVSDLNSNTLFPLIFDQGKFPMKTLVLRRCWLDFNDLDQSVKNNQCLSQLTTLDMSDNPFIHLSTLMSHNLPHLEILVLRQCRLNSDDLISLTKASNQGRLPELRHLDISQNDIGWASKGICRLFDELNVFPSLINLILCACGLEVQDLRCLTQAKLDGKLPRLRHLDISLNELSDHVGILLSLDPITQREISWGNVICYEEKKKKVEKETEKKPPEFNHRNIVSKVCGKKRNKKR